VAQNDAQSETSPESRDEREIRVLDRAADKQLPDIVRDVEECMSEKDVEVSWSREVVASVTGQCSSDEVVGAEDCNANDKDVTGAGGVCVSQSDVSSQSSFDDQLEVVSSVDDAGSKGHSSVAEPIDLSDTEQPVYADLAAGRELADTNVEQVLPGLRQDSVTTRGSEKAGDVPTGDVTHMDNGDVVHDVDAAVDGNNNREELVDGGVRMQPLLAENVARDQDIDHIAAAGTDEAAEVSRAEVPAYSQAPLGDSSLTAGEVVTELDALRELDAYLSSILETTYRQSTDGANRRITNAAANNDDVSEENENCLSSRDEVDTVSTTDDADDAEQCDMVDYVFVEVPPNCRLKDLVANADVSAHDNDAVQPDADDDAYAAADEPSVVDNAADILQTKTAARMSEINPVPDYNVFARIRNETVAEDRGGPDVEDHGSGSPTQLAGVNTFEASTYGVSGGRSEKLTTNVVDGDAVEMADAEVDAILCGRVGGSLDEQVRCCIRRVNDDHAVDHGETDSCSRSSPMSNASDVDHDAATRLPVTRPELEFAREERSELAGKKDLPDSSKNDESRARTLKASDDQDRFERDKPGDGDTERDGRIAEVNSTSNRHSPPVEIDKIYSDDELEAESDRASSDLELSLAVEPSFKAVELPDEMETDMGVRSETVDEDRSPEASHESSPGSNLSWRSCSSAASETDENAADQLGPECVPGYRGVTASQILSYRKFCDDRRRSKSAELEDYSGKMAQRRPEDEDDGRTPYPCVDDVDVLPPQNHTGAHGAWQSDGNNFPQARHHSHVAGGSGDLDESGDESPDSADEVAEGDMSMSL